MQNPTKHLSCSFWHKPLTIFAKSSILDNRLGSEYVPGVAGSQAGLIFYMVQLPIQCQQHENKVFSFFLLYLLFVFDSLLIKPASI